MARDPPSYGYLPLGGFRTQAASVGRRAWGDPDIRDAPFAAPNHVGDELWRRP
jgi:hypothetical protein